MTSRTRKRSKVAAVLKVETVDISGGQVTAGTLIHSTDPPQ